jgi:hypothetical protein
MGTAREAVAGSGNCPACKHSVSIPNCLSAIFFYLSLTSPVAQRSLVNW